jgi:hypothetical protein
MLIVCKRQREYTYEMKPSNFTSGVISLPSAPNAFDRFKVYNIVTTAMKIELSAKYIPGQMLYRNTSVLPSDEH